MSTTSRPRDADADAAPQDASGWPPEFAHLSYWELVGRRVRAVVTTSHSARDALADIAYVQGNLDPAWDAWTTGIGEARARRG